jgi:hypothetical protein
LDLKDPTTRTDLTNPRHIWPKSEIKGRCKNPRKGSISQSSLGYTCEESKNKKIGVSGKDALVGMVCSTFLIANSTRGDGHEHKLVLAAGAPKKLAWMETKLP